MTQEDRDLEQEFANSKELETLEKYLTNQGRESLIIEINTSVRSKEDLDARQLRVAKEAQDIQNAQNADKELQKSAEQTKDLRKPYGDAKRINGKIARYLSLKAKERGYE